VSGREKHPYSIWRKMQERHISFEQLTDIMAFRVIVPTEANATRRSGMIHRKLANGPGPLQGLYLDPEAQRLSLAAHDDDPCREYAHRNPDPH
jgi:guanosine-3',5'-bis(diphosphate) 3'-pyrophosphohydrolase